MASSLPDTVDCLLQPDSNKPEVIRSTMPLQLPVEEQGEHLVRVECVAPTAHELLWAPDFPGRYADNKVFVPCFDFAGTVVQAPRQSPFQPGAEVCGSGKFNYTGHAREYTVAQSSSLVLKPARLSWEQAASLPMSACTAYQALFEHGGGLVFGIGKSANSTKRLLITAAAGGVGIWALQLARASGVGTIVAVCGPDNIDFVKSLGATDVINYREQTIDDWCRSNGQVDLVFDMVGHYSFKSCWAAIKNDGKLVTVKEPPEPDRPSDKSESQGYFFIFEPNGQEMAKMADLVDTGIVKVFTDSVWSLDQYKEAFARCDTGHCRGKVIIKFPGAASAKVSSAM